MKSSGVVEPVVNLELLEVGVAGGAKKKRLVWEERAGSTGGWQDAVKFVETRFSKGCCGEPRRIDLFSYSPGGGVAEKIKVMKINRWAAMEELFVLGQVGAWVKDNVAVVPVLIFGWLELEGNEDEGSADEGLRFRISIRIREAG